MSSIFLSMIITMARKTTANINMHRLDLHI